MCAAAAELYSVLQSGSYSLGNGKKRAVAGDISKLKFAHNLSPEAKLLQRNLSHVSSQVNGTQEVRTKIGDALLGARIVYGEPLFVTVSPSSRHSGLVLRLSRVRPEDPTLRSEDMSLGDAQRLGSADYPSLHACDDTSLIDLPDYDVRQKWQAKDGLCGIEAFRVWALRVFPLLFGMRTCPFCPYCNSHTSYDIRYAPCQDIFGSNMLACGGFCGGCDAFGAAAEHQFDGNPHLHAHVHLVNVYQHSTIFDLANKLRSGLINETMLKSFHMAICIIGDADRRAFNFCHNHYPK